MSQIIKPNSGGGGGGFVETITPNSGGPVSAVSNNINDQGLAANAGGNAFPVFSYNGGNPNVQWENRAYLSAYVVDTSVTDGSKGTFSTLGAAINQAIADGATGTPGIAIYLRNVTITETITVSTNGVNISILGTGGKNNQEIPGGNPQFNGSFTNSGTGNILFSNIDFTSSSTVTNSGTGILTLTDCYNAATIVQSHASGGMFLNNSYMAGNSITLSGGNITSYLSTYSGGTLTLSNSGNIGYLYCNIGQTWTGSSAATVAISLVNSLAPLTANTISSGVILTDNSNFGTFDFFANTNVSYQMNPMQQGNTFLAKRVSGNYAAFFYDYYIGVTSTSSSFTITLPTSGLIKNQSFIIKDESGAAGTNNIVVTVAGGVKTIDGLTSYPININYGSIQVIYDGTNFFIV